MSRLRNRIIKATYYTDPDLCRMPRDKREFYRSLWACAEDSACLEDDMFGVKLAAWPSPLDSDMTVERFETWRDELIAEGKLVRYEVAGQPYLYIPSMAEHERPRNPQSPDCPLPEWVQWNGNVNDSRKGHYTHTTVVQALYNDATTPPALPCPVLPCTDLSGSKDKTLSSSTIGKIPDAVFGYWTDKMGREPNQAEARSLRVLCRKYTPAIVNAAIGQACVQGAGPDSFALITTIAKAEAGAS